MNSKLKTFLQIFIPLVLAGLLLWYVLSKVDVPSMWKKIASADPKWIILAVIISLLSHLSRAYRWNLLMEPLGHKPSLKNTFSAVMIGYFGNIIIPRGGEVFRCVVLNRIDKVPFNSSFGTVVAERAFDFFCLLILIGLSLILEFDKFSVFLSDALFQKDQSNSGSLLGNPLILLLLSVILLASIAVIIYRKTIFMSPLFLKSKSFALGVWEGVLSIKKMQRKGAFLFHTFFIWAGYYFMTYIVFFSLPATAGLGPIAGLVILIIGGLGMAAPVSGGIGTFHLMVGGALQLFYNLSEDDGVAYAFVIHGSQIITIIVVGLFCTVIVMMKARKIQRGTPISDSVKVNSEIN
jgi:uncharacterized membrane protein YbhN (UPF0104 family)